MILLDTHAVIWAFSDKAKLSKAAAAAIVGEDSVYVSVASFWEIALKKNLGKLDFDFSICELSRLCERQNIFILPILPRHIDELEGLPYIHRDPFDRMLVAQARAENLALVTKDPIVSKYDVKTLW